MPIRPVVTSIQPLVFKAIPTPDLKRIVWAQGGAFIAAIYGNAPVRIARLDQLDQKLNVCKSGVATDVAFRPSDYFDVDEPCIEAAVASGKGSTGAQLVDLLNFDVTIARATWTQSVAYSDLGRFLICGAADGQLSAFDLLGAPQLSLEKKVSKKPIISVAAGPGALTKSEPLVAYAVSDGKVFRLRGNGGKKVETTDALAQLPTKEGEPRGCNMVAAHAASDLAAFAVWHRDLASGRLSTRVVVGDFDGRKPDLFVLPRPETTFVRQISFLPNRCQLAICDEHSVELWSLGVTPKLMMRREIDKPLAPFAVQQFDHKLMVVCA